MSSNHKQHIPLDKAQDIRPQLGGKIQKPTWCPEDGRKRTEELVKEREVAYENWIEQQRLKDPMHQRLVALESQVKALTEAMDKLNASKK